MEFLEHMSAAFLVVLQPVNLFALFVGLVLGMLVAVLPGLTLVMGIVLALPFTYGMAIMPSITLLTAMYVSGTYGGAFTAILFRIPGEPLDVPLLWDGYSMAHSGEPAKALGWTLFAALAGGLVSTIAVALIVQPLASFALRFDAPDLFAVILFALSGVVALGGSSLANAFISLFLGLIIASVGVDPVFGESRLTLGIPILGNGIEYLIVMVGAYGIGEILVRLESGFETESIGADGSVRTELPSPRKIWEIRGTLARSSVLGTILGIVPGAGATIASFVSYGVESQYSGRRKLLGTGIPEGIVAPQTASTATVAGAMAPLLTLGIPGSGATAIILGAFLLHGLQPGPELFVTNATLGYSVFASLIIGVLGMCLVGYFAIKLLVKVLYFPEAITSAFVMLFCFMGAFAARNSVIDLWMIVAFGIVGYLFEKYKFPIAPMVLGCILGSTAEDKFLTTMLSYKSDWTVFFTRPISGTMMLVAILTLMLPLAKRVLQLRRRRLGLNHD